MALVGILFGAHHHSGTILRLADQIAKGQLKTLSLPQLGVVLASTPAEVFSGIDIIDPRSSQRLFERILVEVRRKS